MRTIYLDCSMGAAGDMLTGALLELLPDPDAFIEKLNALQIPGVLFQREKAIKCGITGTHVSVRVHGLEEHSDDYFHHHTHNHMNSVHDHHHHEAPSVPHHADDEQQIHVHVHDHLHDHDHPHEPNHLHHHHSMKDIETIIAGLSVGEKVKADILAVYNLIAQAESAVHGRPVAEVHFHEVGAMDAIADVTAVSLLMHELAPEQVIVSPIHVGSGHVRCAHGIVPVPAPATAKLLEGIPMYSGEIAGELCTPTGAALLKHFATSFGAMPLMVTQAIGYGMGTKEFPVANCVRAFLAETGNGQDEVCELKCNVDDMTGEELGFAMEQLFEAGAVEVFTVPITMKKSRPGILLHVLCPEKNREQVVKAIFQYTTTIGIRESRSHRYVLDRRIEPVQTPYGEVRIKHSEGYGVERYKYEYEDVARIARENQMSLSQARNCLKNLRKDDPSQSNQQD